MPLFNNRTKKVAILVSNKSRNKSRSRSRSKSNSFTRKRNLIATRFVSRLNTYKSKILERNTKSRALTQKLRTTLVSALDTIQKSDDCSLCLSKIDLKEPITTLECGHKFHSRCLYNYINKTRDLRCPLCRASIQLTSLDSNKLSEELALKFKSDAAEANVHETRAMLDQATAYVTRMNEDIVYNPDLMAVMRRRLERATQARDEAHEMYNDALRLYTIAFENYYTYMYVNNIDNTRQIV
jgi:hypothetical protein